MYYILIILGVVTDYPANPYFLSTGNIRQSSERSACVSGQVVIFLKVCPSPQISAVYSSDIQILSGT